MADVSKLYRKSLNYYLITVHNLTTEEVGIQSTTHCSFCSHPKRKQRFTASNPLTLHSL